MMFPKITFVCPCYNHEKYIKVFLNSLLDQTNPNWELIIIDDCSTDNSVKCIQSIHDKRIHLIQNPFNMGINANVSYGIQTARTELVAFVASDDALYPEYVEVILRTFNEHRNIDACYTPLRHINKNGDLLDSFTQLPISKTESQIFSDMFLGDNLLPSPGMAFKKTIFKAYLPLDTGLIQYSDYQMHFFVLFNHKIKMLDVPLVKYRLSQDSASARKPGTLLREELETTKLMDNVVSLIETDKKQFNRIFGNHILFQNKKITTETIPFWLGRLALTSTNLSKQKWGLQTIMNYISNKKHMVLLNKLYGFSFKDYLKYASMIVQDDRTTIELEKKNRKIKKYKILSNILIILYILLIGGLIWL